MTDYEFYRGRKLYASNITGAYYAARKAVCEYLYKIRRQARILIFREVSSGYVVPLCVWVIRETVKNAMESINPVIADNLNSVLSKMAEGFVVDLKNWKKSSKLINLLRLRELLTISYNSPMRLV